MSKRRYRSGGPTSRCGGILGDQRGLRFIHSAAPTFKWVTDQRYTIDHSLEAATSLTLGEWHHIAGVFDGSEGRIYVDCALSGQMASIGDPTVASVWKIGNVSGGGTGDGFFSGYIDEVRVYDRALTTDEVCDLYCPDQDGDGFCVMEDCDDTDPDVHPDHAELPGNFIDENCDGTLGDCDPCFTWRNHGEYVRCVAHEVNYLVQTGGITEEEGDGLVSNAATSDVGKKGYVPQECN